DEGFTDDVPRIGQSAEKPFQRGVIGTADQKDAHLRPFAIFWCRHRLAGAEQHQADEEAAQDPRSLSRRDGQSARVHWTYGAPSEDSAHRTRFLVPGQGSGGVTHSPCQTAWRQFSRNPDSLDVGGARGASVFEDGRVYKMSLSGRVLADWSGPR